MGAITFSGAANVIPCEEADRLVSHGAEELPTQWIERDKNELRRQKGEHV